MAATLITMLAYLYFTSQMHTFTNTAGWPQNLGHSLLLEMALGHPLGTPANPGHRAQRAYSAPGTRLSCTQLIAQLPLD